MPAVERSEQLGRTNKKQPRRQLHKNARGLLWSDQPTREPFFFCSPRPACLQPRRACVSLSVRMLSRRGSSAAQRAAASEACKSISLERLQAQYHRPLSEGQSEAASKRIVINFFHFFFAHCSRGSISIAAAVKLACCGCFRGLRCFPIVTVVPMKGRLQ